MTGWREKRREARWKRKARMRNLERINKNKKCLAAKIIWICSRLPWRRELKWFFRSVMPCRSCRLPWRRELKYTGNFSRHWWFGRLPWRRELKWPSCQLLLQQRRRLPWRRELRILAFRPYKCAVIERL